MSIDKETVKKVARLARLKVTEEETAVLTGELSRILDLVSQLNAVKTAGVEPLTSVIEMQLPLRPDAVTDGGIADRILANAPEATAGFFVVPKVVE